MKRSDIARALDCSFQSVSYHLEKAGLYNPEEARQKRRKTVDSIVKLYESGLTTKEIAKIVGHSQQDVSRIAIRNGCKPRGRGSGKPTDSICPRCGKKFVAIRQNQEFCSETCRAAVAWSRRNDLKRDISDGPIESIPLREVYKRDHGRCYICGRTTDWNDFHIVNGNKIVGLTYPTRDHVIALHNGGTHTWDNVRLACMECNSKKGASGQMRLAI